MLLLKLLFRPKVSRIPKMGACTLQHALQWHALMVYAGSISLARATVQTGYNNLCIVSIKIRRPHYLKARTNSGLSGTWALKHKTHSVNV